MIIITGPTATGKSNVALKLAEMIDGEIISADSMQVYKHMDIGTAKPSKSELNQVKHHLVDVVEPDFPFSATVFKNIGTSAISDIYHSNKIPILAGGTGFYINALIYGCNAPEIEEKRELTYRNYLYNLADEKGNDYLFDILKSIDPEYAEKTHANNVKRVARALEYYHDTNEKFSVYNSHQKDKRELLYDIYSFILNYDRDKLYSRIDKRVDEMINAGLVDEVRGLKDMGYSKSLTSMQGLGYKEILAYLDNECTLDEAVCTLKRDTRHFAKRQITWFTHQFEGEWLNVSDYLSAESIAEYIKEKVGV
jgi:tRNA dimethylallyltransferase